MLRPCLSLVCLFLLLAAGICSAQQCGDCTSCVNRASCVPSVCPQCPSLADAFASDNRTLIMKIHINMNHSNSNQVSYLATVDKIYQVRPALRLISPIPLPKVK